jgi:hypothetical protein
MGLAGGVGVGRGVGSSVGRLILVASARRRSLAAIRM